MTRTAVNPIRWMLWATWLVAALLAALSPARAIEQGPFGMEILVDGQPLSEYHARGRAYVEALAGKEYSVRLSNHTGGRVAIALAVDGLNSIDAKSGAADEGSKWILGPYEVITIDGWQTSSSNARRFYFTTETASYGAWLGDTSNLGIVAAAIFRERVPLAKRILPSMPRRDAAAEPQSAPPPAAAKPEQREAKAGDRENAAGAEADSPAELSEELAATGIGREVDHRVERVRFDAEPKAAATLSLRYEYRDALIKLGVLPLPCDPVEGRLARRDDARGFSESGFAPDPYRRPTCR